MQPNQTNGRMSWRVMPPKSLAIALGVSLVAIALIVNLVRLKLQNPNRTGTELGFAMLGMIAVAGLIAASRGGTIIDTTNRRLTRWWGPLIPVRKVGVNFDEIRAVKIGVGLRPGSAHATRPANGWCHVAIQTERGLIVVRQDRDDNEIRRCAAAIATAVGCEVEGSIF